MALAVAVCAEVVALAIFTAAATTWGRELSEFDGEHTTALGSFVDFAFSIVGVVVLTALVLIALVALTLVGLHSFSPKTDSSLDFMLGGMHFFIAFMLMATTVSDGSFDALIATICVGLCAIGTWLLVEGRHQWRRSTAILAK